MWRTFLLEQNTRLDNKCFLIEITEKMLVITKYHQDKISSANIFTINNQPYTADGFFFFFVCIFSEITWITEDIGIENVNRGNEIMISYQVWYQVPLCYTFFNHKKVWRILSEICLSKNASKTWIFQELLTCFQNFQMCRIR